MRKMRTVFISGNFSILHPGHFRLFSLAKKIGDRLVIGLNRNLEVASNIHIPYELRKESLEAVKLIDEVIEVGDNLGETILRVRPEIILKGSEHSKLYNLEQSLLESYGGKLLFGSGDFSMSSEEFIEAHRNNLVSNPLNASQFLERNCIDPPSLNSTLTNFRNLEVLILGDLIIDEYTECESVGLSQEEPIVVFRQGEKKRYVGGAGIVALHANSLGAKTHFVTITGNDHESSYAEGTFEEAGLDSFLIKNDASSTILKQRFRVNGRSTFRLTRYDDFTTSNEYKDRFMRKVEELIPKMDVLIFSDFNYGLLQIDIVEKVIRLARENGLFIAADCQISSQIADYHKYKSVDLVTPTEHEARVTLRDGKNGLAATAIAFQKELQAKNLIVTLGADGALMQEWMPKASQEFQTDLIPALNDNPIDVSGAGDSMLIVSALALRLGARLSEAAYLGSLASAIQVGRQGNQPIAFNELSQELFR